MAWVRVVLLLGVVVFLSQLNRWVVFDKLIFILLILLCLSFLWSRFMLAGLVLTRRTNTDRAHVGELVVDQIEITNQSRLSKLWIEVTDHSTLPDHRLSRVVSLAPGATIRWRAKTLCTRRGRYYLGPVVLQASDPFGLFERHVVIPQTQELLVYPALVDLTNVRVVAGELPGGNALQKRTPFVTPNVAGVRQYQPGDSFNRIAWSATARTGQLMVKEFELDPSMDVWLVLDGDRTQHSALTLSQVVGSSLAPGDSTLWLDSTEEYAVTIVASLARFFLGVNRSVGLISQGASPIVLPPDRGPRHLVKILEFLALFRADATTPLQELLAAEQVRFGRRSAVIVVTSSTNETWVRALAELVAHSVHCIAIVVEPSTFGSGSSSLLVVSELTALGIPFVLVKRGDDLSRVLATPVEQCVRL